MQWPKSSKEQTAFEKRHFGISQCSAEHEFESGSVHFESQRAASKNSTTNQVTLYKQLLIALPVFPNIQMDPLSPFSFRTVAKQAWMDRSYVVQCTAEDLF